MLAPDETAQLIANVVQKIGYSPRTGFNTNHNQTAINMDFSIDQQ